VLRAVFKDALVSTPI